MKKLFLLGAMVCALGMRVSAQNKYEMDCRIEGDSLFVKVDCVFEKEYPEVDFFLLTNTANIRMDDTAYTYSQKEDTVRFENMPLPKYFRMCYILSLKDYQTSDGAIVLRREGNWYPHRNGELLTADVDVKTDGYYIIGGSETKPSFDLHLILLPKDKYECRVIDDEVRPFYFYQNASDTVEHPATFYREFVDSYVFYCSFFGDSLSSQPMNIVEIGDPQFMMCQSLRDMIIFGPYFLQVYKMIPDFSWVPHEVAHQWWGNSIFFEHRDYALGESLNEYIKLQFLKSRGRGYEEQMGYYTAMKDRAAQSLPIADIRSVESQDESIAIYHTAPLLLEQMKDVDVADLLIRLYKEEKRKKVTRDIFAQKCKPLQAWLNAE